MQKTRSKRLHIVFESDIKPVAAEQADPSHNKGSTKGHLGEFIAIASVPLVLVLGNSMLVPILPDMKDALHISQFQSSLVITLFSITAAVAIPIIGFLSDRYGRKPIIIPALIVYGSAGLLAGLGAIWGSYPILITARAVQGLGAAGTAPIAMALAGDLYDGAVQSKALGLTEASNGIGKVISPILGALLALIVWHAAFFAFPGFCMLSLLAVLFLIKEPKKNKEPVKLKKYLHAIGSLFKKQGKWLVPAFFAGSLALFILFGVLFYLSNILEKPPYRVDGVLKGAVLAIPLMGMVITSYTTGSLIKKNGVLMRRLMLLGLIMMAASLGLTIFFFKQIYVFIGLLTLSSIGTGLVLPCLNSLITGTVETQQRGMITSLYSSLRFLGVALGPPLFGWMMNRSDRLVFISVSALSLLSLGLIFFLIKPPKKVG